MRQFPPAVFACLVLALISPALRGQPTTAGTAESTAERIASDLAILRQGDVFHDTDRWAAAIRDLESVGRDAVPALCEQLRNRPTNFMQRSIPCALRAINDKRAVPALIWAMERCTVHTSDCGTIVPDPELAFYYAQKQINPRLDERDGTFGVGRPVREITATLEHLTGHTEGIAAIMGMPDMKDKPQEANSERERMLIRAVAGRWRQWWDANKAKLLSPQDLTWCEQFDRQPTSQPSDPLTLALHVDRPDSSPAAAASVEVWADRFHTRLAVDRNGDAAVSCPREVKNLSIIARADKCVTMRIHFSTADESIPAKYAVKLPEAVTFGGIVTDEGGQPVRGAVVFSINNPPRDEHEYATVSDLSATTGDDGSWAISGFPDDLRSFSFRVNHPDYENDDAFGKDVTYDQLYYGKAVFMVKRLFAVEGTVVDESGKPIAGARIYVGGPKPYIVSQAVVITDSAGRFKVTGIERGKVSVGVQADGYAPAVLTTNAGANSESLKVTLAPGRRVRGRITGKSGEPVGGAIVAYGAAGGFRLTDFQTRTDADGRFEWATAPKEPFSLRVHKSGFDIKTQPVAATDTDLAVTLAPALQIAGRVTDVRTAKPIEAFRLFPGIIWGEAQSPSCWRSQVEFFTGGTYAKRYYSQGGRRDASPQFVRIEADGYKPVVSRTFNYGDGAMTMDFALEPSELLRGSVSTPDGKAAATAQVAIATPSIQADFYRGTIRRENYKAVPPPEPREQCLFVLSDEHGHFALPPQIETFEIIVAHDSGWARVPQTDYEKSPAIRLQPWARISGKVTRADGAPADDAQMTLSYPAAHRSVKGQPRIQFFSTTQASRDGTYEFAKVFPDSYRLSGQHSDARNTAVSFSGPGIPIKLVAGQSVKLDFGPDGQRDVTGQIKLPDSVTGVDLSSATLTLERPRRAGNEIDRNKITPEPTTAATTGPAARADASGAFRFARVPAGPWSLKVALAIAPDKDAPNQLARKGEGGAGFEVPAGDGGDPIDLGPVSLAVKRAPIAVGNLAPRFEVKTVDGQPLKLADYAGKYVLLDFWATWCGPCVAETPHLKSAYEAFKDDPRFVIIGLSLDSDPSRPKTYARENQIQWVQGFLGDWSKKTVADDYGVTGIPTILLISPNGKVLATDLRGETVKDELAKHLK